MEEGDSGMYTHYLHNIKSFFYRASAINGGRYAPLYLISYFMSGQTFTLEQFKTIWKNGNNTLMEYGKKQAQAVAMKKGGKKKKKSV
mgnify:CR=1 FL=1